jgi:hypothetical protein
MRWKEACYGGTDVMERSCAVVRGKDINSYCTSRIPGAGEYCTQNGDEATIVRR